MENSIEKANTDKDPQYGLGCTHVPGIGYGHNGATEGYLSLMMHNPENDVTTIVLLPFWDVSQNMKNFRECLELLTKTSAAAQKIVQP